MRRAEFTEHVIASLPQQPAAASLATANLIADLLYDPALSDDDPKQLNIAARSISVIASNLYTVSDKLFAKAAAELKALREKGDVLR